MFLPFCSTKGSLQKKLQAWGVQRACSVMESYRCCCLPQVALYKYIVNVEGNCAALRLKQLLAGPSAVFFVQSDEIEWFYPLLTPYVHYIPVSFSQAGVTQYQEVSCCYFCNACTLTSYTASPSLHLQNGSNAIFFQLGLWKGSRCVPARVLILRCS